MVERLGRPRSIQGQSRTRSKRPRDAKKSLRACSWDAAGRSATAQRAGHTISCGGDAERKGRTKELLRKWKKTNQNGEDGDNERKEQE